MRELDQLIRQVEQNPDFGDSTRTVIHTVAQKINDYHTNPQALLMLAQALQQKADAIAIAVSGRDAQSQAKPVVVEEQSTEERSAPKREEQ